MQEVIFEVTKDHLETGMRGFPVGYCTSSSVDPVKGLYYSGRPLSEIAHWNPEEVIYLLRTGQQGSEADVQNFYEEIKKRSKCSEKTIEHIRNLPREAHPMKLFSCALLICGALEGTGNYSEDSLNVVAKMPEIVANVIHHHAGWGECNPSKPELGYMENFSQMLNVPDANKEELTRVFRLFNVLHYDHGGGNLSAFVGKAVASGLEDLYGSLSAAMCGLAGPRHGKANQDCLDFVKQVQNELGDDVTAEKIEGLVRKRLENKELVFGFGHAVLRVEDPRATVLYQAGQDMRPDHPLVKVASLLRTEGTKVLKENPKIQNPYPNVDAISGTLLAAVDFDYPEYFTVMFGLSRCVGIAFQIVYEREEARNGKGTPIIRPKFFYKAKTEAPLAGQASK
ncbi:MAG: citrate synthase [Chlamydiales bacterium]|jgi:citrate synthase